MRIFIIGASGLIGGNLMRHLQDERSWNVVGTYFSYEAHDCVFYNTLDPTDERNVNISDFNPEIIVHCGALTWVDYCEENEAESYEKTVVSTINAVELARQCNSKFVFISTDYVFDGENGPYRESDKVNPISIYGKHKLDAEKIVMESGLPYLIGRVTNVYGNEERGKNFIARLVEKAIAEESEEMSFPIDQYATPINAADVARAIAVLIEADKTGTYHLASTDYVNRYQLATMVLKHFPRNKIRTLPVLTKDMKQRARRPLNGGLLSAKFLDEFPSFEFTNVSDYINELQNL